MIHTIQTCDFSAKILAGIISSRGSLYFLLTTSWAIQTKFDVSYHVCRFNNARHLKTIKI